jgi:hypothetical protein
MLTFDEGMHCFTPFFGQIIMLSMPAVNWQRFQNVSPVSLVAILMVASTFTNLQGYLCRDGYLPLPSSSTEAEHLDFGFRYVRNEFLYWENHFSLSHRSPYLSPFIFGFLVARVRYVLHMLSLIQSIHQLLDSWRWAYAIGSIYSAVVSFLIVFFMEEHYTLL